MLVAFVGAHSGEGIGRNHPTMLDLCTRGLTSTKSTRSRFKSLLDVLALTYIYWKHNAPHQNEVRHHMRDLDSPSLLTSATMHSGNYPNQFTALIDHL